jgi:uncharacterized protein (DUF362 family)
MECGLQSAGQKEEYAIMSNFVLNRREFLLTASAAALAGPPEKSRVGLVSSSHTRLMRPAPEDHRLDYDRVRDMVWQAMEYGRPRAGSLEAKIRPGSWVVIKPNIVFLRPQPSYRPGDVTDMRVTRAVLEYVARRSQAGRITVAEGGSYRSTKDPAPDNAVTQYGRRVDALGFDWGPGEFPGIGGSVGDMLRDFQREFPKTKFDYVDLSYDAVREASGQFARVEVPRTSKGVGAFSLRKEYFITNTIRNCDFLIAVPVMKVHLDCGITACFKSYVGTAPREAYAAPGKFWNVNLHAEHSVEGRIDPFIVDLAAFHPPDYNVVDGIQGLQYQEHNIGRADQTLRNNLVLAGEDTVATDAVVAYLMGFNPWDMEFLHLAEQRDLGTLDLNRIEVRGEEADRLRRPWGKPKGWFGRCNREWLVSGDPEAPLARWTQLTIPTDTLKMRDWKAAAVRVRAEGHRKAFLWVGVRGRATANLNGETVMAEENTTRYRIGQFQKAVELRPGENLLRFQVEPVEGEPLLSALLVGPRNDGDTVEGIRWTIR